jgi:hypothetical protein
MPLQLVLPDFPFSKWGLDFIGPINPPSSVGHIFILTTTYYFTKWIEVVPLKRAQDEQVIYFLESNIFSLLVFLLKLFQIMDQLLFLQNSLNFLVNSE